MTTTLIKVGHTQKFHLGRFDKFTKIVDAFNGKYLLVVAENFELHGQTFTDRCYILLYSRPYDQSSMFCLVNELDKVVFNKCIEDNFVFYMSGYIILINQSLKRFTLSKIHLQLEEKFEVTEIVYVPSLRRKKVYCSRAFSENHFLGILYELVGSNSDILNLKVFNCETQIKEIHHINLSSLQGSLIFDEITDVFFINNCERIVLMTAESFLFVFLSSAKMLEYEKGFTEYLFGYDDFGLKATAKLCKIDMNGLADDILIPYTCDGKIVNFNKKHAINLKKVFQKESPIFIMKAFVCPFNKYVYLCPRKPELLFVYDPQKENVYQYELFSSSFCSRLSSINWFGDEFYLQSDEDIYIEKLISEKMFSLKHFARKVLLKRFSSQEILKMNLGKKLNYLVFNIEK